MFDFRKINVKNQSWAQETEDSYINKPPKFNLF